MKLAPDLRDQVLVSATSIAELSRRPSRRPDHATENHVLMSLMQDMATSPDTILQKLSDVALTLCRAHSAGLSLLEDEDQHQNFHWRAISGEWASHLNGGTPRDFGPCGTVLDRNMPLLFSHPERDFPYFGDVSPLLEEALLIPFYINGKARGTIWVVLHDAKRHFDVEDLRIMTDLGQFAGVAYQTILSLKEARTSHRQLSQSDAAIERFMAIIESSNDAIFSKNSRGIINSWNPSAERLFGYTALEAIGKPGAMLIPADRMSEEPEILARVGRGERINHYETQRLRKGGSIVDISLTVSPIRDARGRVIGASKIARDITDQKRAQERQTFLVTEIKHRIRNTLSIVQAIAMQTLRGTSLEERDGFIARLHSLSHAHDVLTKESWDRASLSDLISITLEPFRSERHDCFTIRGPEVWLDASKSMLLTMVVHELATNAGKYGALSNAAGRISINWSLQADNPKIVIFWWQEEGGPVVVAPTRRGFGSNLIQTAFKSGLGGYALQFLPGGVSCTLRIQL